QSILSNWHLGNQQAIAEALHSVEPGGSTRLTIRAPESAVEKGRHEVLAEVDIIVERFEEPEYHFEEVVLTVHEQADWKGSPLANAFTVSLLACVHPPETDWDSACGSYSNMLEIGTLSNRVDELLDMHERGVRAIPQMVAESHYVHRRDLSERVVVGRAARSLCGVYFVPRQDHADLPVCPGCSAAYVGATSYGSGQTRPETQSHSPQAKAMITSSPKTITRQLQQERPALRVRSSVATSAVFSARNMPIIPAMAPWKTAMMARIMAQPFLKDFSAFLPPTGGPVSSPRISASICWEEYPCSTMSPT